MKVNKITIEEVSNILGISEGTILNNWKQCKDKALGFGIEKVGRGKKAIYIQTISEDKNKIAYDILRELLINECNFNTRTDFKKLIHYIYLVLLNSIDEEYNYNNLSYMDRVGLCEKNLIRYRTRLTEGGLMKPKSISKGIYAYLDLENNYTKCDVDLYDNFNRCVFVEAKRLFKESYLVNLTDYKDYQRAKDIITNDFDIEDLYANLESISSVELKKELLKDSTTNLFLNDNNINRFYKIAFYEVSKAWEEELGIKHVRFFPNHILSDSITKDMTMVTMITEAYAYTIYN